MTYFCFPSAAEAAERYVVTDLENSKFLGGVRWADDELGAYGQDDEAGICRLRQGKIKVSKR